MEPYLEFEKPILSLEKKLQDLRELAKTEGVDFSDEISILDQKVSTMIDEIYARLTPWQKVQLSRHPNRPYSLDYIEKLFPSFMELAGDRTFADDRALIGGIGLWPPADVSDAESDRERIPDPDQVPVVIIGHQKGRTTKQKMERNFGMGRPEGYRKAMRLMRMAERFKMPLITLIDTPGAYPGKDAEERGQAQAIAESIQLMAGLEIPTLAVVIGEGGSGGALGLGVANQVLAQEFTIYSVISPESCASILWSDSTLAERSSEKLKCFPEDLLRLGAIDAIVPEPKGGAHRDWIQAASLLRDTMIERFDPLIRANLDDPKAPERFVRERLAKFRNMGNLALATTQEPET